MFPVGLRGGREGGGRREEEEERRRWGPKEKQNHHLGVRKNMHQIEDIFRKTRGAFVPIIVAFERPRCICAYYSNV